MPYPTVAQGDTVLFLADDATLVPALVDSVAGDNTTVSCTVQYKAGQFAITTCPYDGTNAVRNSWNWPTVPVGAAISLANVGASPSAKAATLVSGVLTLQPADATHPGVVTTGTQTLAGAKTFSSDAVFSGYITAGNDINTPGTLLSSAIQPHTTNSSITLTGTASNGASAVAVVINSSNTFSTSGAKLLSVQNNGTEEFSVDKAGQVVSTSGGYGLNGNQAPTQGLGYSGAATTVRANTGGIVYIGDASAWGLFVTPTNTAFQGDVSFPYTDLSGTAGAGTANTTTGKFKLDATHASAVITNSTVLATSIVIATVLTNDTTCKAVQCVPAGGGGSFTAYASATPTGSTIVGFIVINGA